jgi:hypothetical protein
MLVCSVSQLRRRAAISADLAEAAAALDAPGTGNVVFATLVDDPASVGDRVDAFLGQIMVEAASAASTVNAGLAYAATLAEAAGAADAVTGSVPLAASLAEAATAADAPSASVITSTVVTAAVVETAAADSTQDVPMTWDPATVALVTLSGSNLTATNTGTTQTEQGAKGAGGAAKASGKWYFEVTGGVNTGGSNVGVGIGTPSSTYTSMGNVGAVTGNELFNSGNIWANGSSTGITLGSWITGPTLIGIAVDLDNRKIWFRKGASGNWNANATYNPATNTGGVTIPSGSMVPYCTFGGAGGDSGRAFTANFGASSFSGAVPSGFTAGWTR